MPPRASRLVAALTLLVAHTGCANFYTRIAATPVAEARITEADERLAVSIAREIAGRHGLRETALPEPVPDLLADFGDASVSLQVWSPGADAPIHFTIGELGAWGESRRTRAIREALLARLARERPDLETSVTTRRDLLPLGP